MDKDSILKYKMNSEEVRNSKRVTSKIERLAKSLGRRYHCIGTLGDCGCMKIVYIRNTGYFLLKQKDRGVVCLGVSDSNEDSFVNKVLSIEMN